MTRISLNIQTSLVLFAFLSSQAISHAETPESIAEKIRREYSSGNKDKALKLAAEGIKKNPKDYTLLTIRGRIYEEENQHAEAERDYTNVLIKNKTDAGIYHRRGVVRFFQLKFNDSLADFDKFIEMVPSQEPYHLSLIHI